MSSQNNESIQKNSHDCTEVQIKHLISEFTHETQNNEESSQNSKSLNHYKDQTNNKHSLNITAMLKQRNADKILM